MSVDVYDARELRAAIDELAGEASDIAPVVAALPRRRPHRQVRWLAPLAAAAAVLLVVGIALFVTRQHASNGGDTLAIGRTEATAAQPCRSTTTPPFDTFVLTGVQTVGQATCSGYRLKYVEAGTVSSVTLYRPEVFSLSRVTDRHRVSSGPVTGWIGAVADEPAQPCNTPNPGQTSLQEPCRSTAFVWRYAPHAWGVVASILSSPQAALQRVASGVRLHAVPLRIPVHLSYVPARLHVSRASSYSDPQPASQRNDNRTFGADLQLSRGGTVAYDIAVEAVPRGQATGAAGTRRITVNGETVYLRATNGHVKAATLVHGNCQLMILPKSTASADESIRILRGAQFSDCTKPSTWPTANDAVGG